MTLKGPHLVLSPDWLSLYFSPQDINTAIPWSWQTPQGVGPLAP